MRWLARRMAACGTGAFLISAIVGCGAQGTSGGGDGEVAGPQAAEADAGPGARGQAANLAAPIAAVAQGPPEAPESGANANAEPAASDAELVREKAAVGVGEKGRDLGEGLVSTPVKVYFQTRERVVFDIQIPKTMSLYKAEHGRGPGSHEEFMEQIIEEGLIRLPELPAGHRYVYDPEQDELFVEHP